MEKSTDKMSVRESWQVFKFIFKFLLPFKSISFGLLFLV